MNACVCGERVCVMCVCEFTRMMHASGGGPRCFMSPTREVKGEAQETTAMPLELVASVISDACDKDWAHCSGTQCKPWLESGEAGIEATCCLASPFLNPDLPCSIAIPPSGTPPPPLARRQSGGHARRYVGGLLVGESMSSVGHRIKKDGRFARCGLGRYHGTQTTTWLLRFTGAVDFCSRETRRAQFLLRTYKRTSNLNEAVTS